MFTPPTPKELLASAVNDELFLNELHLQAGNDAAAVLEALNFGIEHPDVAEALSWIEQLVSECRKRVAAYTAEQDNGHYPIEIFGFDHLCQVWAPEYGTTGPFASHQEAMSYVSANWHEFLVDDQPEIFRFPSERPLASPPLGALRKKSVNTSKRYKIGHAMYSSVGPDLYMRHRRGLFSSDERLTTQQLVLQLVSEWGRADEKIILKQLKATGWDGIAEEVEQVKGRKDTERAEAERRRKDTYEAEAVAFIDNFLAGREDLDGKLVDEAARKWSWGEQGEKAQSDDETSAISYTYARQRYYEALHAYAAAMKIKAGKLH